MSKGLCQSCKHIAEIVHVDRNKLGYCATCTTDFPTPSMVRAIEFLAATVPFKIGDRVECRLGGQLYEGIGHVEDISFNLEDGGTPVFPAFKVIFEEKAYDNVPDTAWYTETCLCKVSDPDSEKV